MYQFTWRIITEDWSLKALSGLFNVTAVFVEKDPNRGIPSPPLVFATRFLQTGSQLRFIWVF
jgi:hypothetical protein